MESLEKEFSSSTDINNSSWYNDFADKLLSENFLLTALEFYAELVECGKELPKLKDFFSNPRNFENITVNRLEVIQSSNLPRSSSQATLDSLDLTRYSEDGERSTDDRIAVLEFELRKAKETINALRANLTQAAELETNKARSQEENLKEKQVPFQGPNPSIKPHEQRALNFLINEYLLLHGYKLTSITFADENESQDFEDWNDVGLNSARPLELLYLYREGLKGVNSSLFRESKDFECQVILYDEVKKNLQINELESEVLQLSNKISSMAIEYSNKISKLENERLIEVDSQRSLTPDPEYFEMIDTIKSNEESETRSDKSNGDWTKIEDKCKKECVDLKSDTQSNFESISNEEKIDSQSGCAFENEEILEDSKTNEIQDDTTSQQSLDAYKTCNNLTEIIFDDTNIKICETNTKPVESVSQGNKMNDEILNIMNIGRAVPEKFKNEMLKYCDIYIPIYNNKTTLTELFKDECFENVTTNHVVEILSCSLPKIIPNIILNKREEIIPLLVLSICLNSNLLIRDKLLNLLFNLKKRPQPEEHSIILQSLLKIAQLKGSNTVENEILPQCWEQITHKYVERRMLAAESCFVLAPYVSEGIRNSLFISIAQQLLQDREEKIRIAGLKIITLLIALISHEDKYSQILDICLQVLDDESEDVIKAAKELLFPTFAQWSFSLNRIQSDLYSKLLLKLKTEKHLHCIQVLEILLPFLIMTAANSECVLKISSNDFPSPTKRQDFCRLCKGLCDPALFYTGQLGKVMGAFDHYTSQPDCFCSDWPELNWIKDVFISAIIEAGDNYWEDGLILKTLISALRYLCLGLGKNVTNYMIKPLLLEKLVECENAVVAGQDYKCAIIPLYLVGVLSTFPEELQEMSNALRRFICALPLCGVSLIPLKVTFEILSQYQTWQILILDALWEGVVHQRPLVRCGSASLLQSVIPYIPEILINTKILSALVTLTNDPEPSVRTSAVPPLGMLVNSKEKVIKEKVNMTFQALLQDTISMENHGLLIQLIKTLGSIYECSDFVFREEVAVPQLSAITALALRTKSKDLVEVLTPVYSTITFCQTQVQLQCASLHLLPGLRDLENVCIQLNLPYSERINSMIKDVERRLAGTKESAFKPVSKSQSEGKRLANVVSTHVVVEDVRNRVNKIFNAKPNTLQNVSGIFKKKT